MKYVLQIFLFFSLFISFTEPGFSLTSDEVSISLNQLSPNNIAEFDINIPQGWKFAKPPEITSKYKQSNFNYKENLKKLSETVYRTSCNIDRNQKDILSFSLFLCKDTCVILNKDFSYTPNNSSNLILLMLLFGFIGGFLLNVMPCVLPVILLKLKYINSRETTVNSIVGNYISFLILASVLSLLKISGETVGWGLHFQNIYFLKFVTIFFFILSLISCNRLHFYWSISLDGFIGNKKDKENKEKERTKGKGFRSKFFKEVLFSVITTMIAIPCTAPLLGTAATFALQESIPNLFLIFIAIATGFSFPFFVALFSNLSFERFFKNPIINKIIKYGVVLTFLWIYWLLFSSVSLVEIIIITVILFISSVMFLEQHNKIAVLLLSGIMFLNISTNPENQEVKFTEVQNLVKQDNIVILNISADWCLSCKYNKLKFLSDEVQNKIKENKIKIIEIDITKKNDKVMKFITKHARSGIPFTIIYGPKNKSGILLSEIPSVTEITKTIDLVK